VILFMANPNGAVRGNTYAAKPNLPPAQRVYINFNKEQVALLVKSYRLDNNLDVDAPITDEVIATVMRHNHTLMKSYDLALAEKIINQHKPTEETQPEPVDEQPSAF
jgi:hypothetical protein